MTSGRGFRVISRFIAVIAEYQPVVLAKNPAAELPGFQLSFQVVRPEPQMIMKSAAVILRPFLRVAISTAAFAPEPSTS